MRYLVRVAGRVFEVEPTVGGVTVDGRAVEAEVQATGDGVSAVLGMDGTWRRVRAYRTGSGTWDVHLAGVRLTAEVLDEVAVHLQARRGADATPSGPRPLRAPMPGLVVRVEVAEGERVHAGQGLVIVEAMKMENELRADAPGRVRAVHVAPGQTVEKNQVLIDFDAPEED